MHTGDVMANILDVMWRTYDAINGWIKFSDTKAGAISAACIAVLAMVFSKIIDFKDFIFSHQAVCFSLAFAVACGFLSIVISIASISPMVDANRDRSLIFFGSIANKYSNYCKYKIAVDNGLRDDQDLLDQITEQVWINSNIVCNKYNKVRWAVCFFLFMITFVLIAGILSLHSIFYHP
jgi:hypothetical protein